MNVKQFAWLLLIVGVLLILNLPVQYYQTNGFPTYQDQEFLVNQTAHIINGTVQPDRLLSVNVTFHQDEFSSFDKLSNGLNGEHSVLHFLEGYVTVRFNVTEKGTLFSEDETGLGDESFFTSSPNGISLGNLGVDAKPGTWYLVMPFYDQTPGFGDFQFPVSIGEYVTKPDSSLFLTIELSIVGVALLATSACVLLGVKRATLLILLPLLIIVLALVNFTAQPTANPKQYPLVYIRPDGSIQGSGGIVTQDNATYFLVNDINASLIVQRDNTVIDGAGHTIQGVGNGTGIDLTDRKNVTVTNVDIRDFEAGIHLQNSTGCSINNNLILNITNGVEALEYSTGNTISDNNISSNGNCGIYFWYASNNKILDNYLFSNALNSGAAIEFDWYSDFNDIVGNSMLQNWAGILLYGSTNETIFHNNFDLNQVQFQYFGYFLPNTLDNGYPSGGNFWSGYTGSDNYSGISQNVTGSDGIGDTPYRTTDDSNVDMYPLMNPYGLNETYALTILPADNGTTSPPPRTYTHLENAQVNVTAKPDVYSGYIFSHWLLNGQQATSQNFIIITLNANYTLQPVFVYVQPPTMGRCTQNPPADDVQENQNVTVSQIITVNNGEEPPQFVYIGYSVKEINGTAWTFDYMTFNNATGAWEGTIPGQSAGTQIQYVTKAITSAGSYVTNDNNGQYYTYTIK